MATKKKPALTPSAAKILEQYRNAGKPAPPIGETANGGDSSLGTPRASTPPPPGSASMRRSGTRGM